MKWPNLSCDVGARLWSLNITIPGHKICVSVIRSYIKINTVTSSAEPRADCKMVTEYSRVPIFHICEHLVLTFHICEYLVLIFHMCEELVPILHICEN